MFMLQAAELSYRQLSRRLRGEYLVGSSAW